MGFSSGNWSNLYNWTSEAASAPIEIAKLDAQFTDYATGMSNCILRDGTGLPTAAIPWNSQNLTGVATLTAVTITASGLVTGTAFTPSSSTVPANGLYLPAANTIGLASNTALRWSVDSTGTHTFSGGAVGQAWNFTSTSTGPYMAFQRSGVRKSYLQWDATSGLLLVQEENLPTKFYTNNSSRLEIAAAGNVTINAPSSGNTLALNSLNTVSAWRATSTGAVSGSGYGYGVGIATGRYNLYTDGADALTIGTVGAALVSLATAGVDRMSIASGGNVTINAPSSGTTLGISAAAGNYFLTGSDGTATFGAYANGASGVLLGANSNHPLTVYTNATARLLVSSSGNVTINSPSSGTTLALTGIAGTSVPLSMSNGTVNGQLDFSGTTSLELGTTSAHALNLFTGNTTRMTIAAASGAVTFTGGLSGITTLAMGGALSGVTNLTMSGAFSGATTGSFSGDLTITTQAVGDSSTKAASTAFVDPARSHGANGYQKLSSGLILQWGETTSVSTNSSAGVTFPVAFGTACYSVTLTPNAATTSNQFAWNVGGTGTTGFTAYNAGATASTAYWWAVGK